LKNHTVTPNGQFFDITKQGFLPKLMEEMYDGRTVYKKKALAAKKELEEETQDFKKIEIRKRIARYENLQLAKKVSLNSAYGALGNQYFRFFDIRQATAITTAGQLSIRWIENKLNQYMNKLLRVENEDYVIASDTDSIYLSLGRLVNKAYLESNPTASTSEVIQFMDRVCENKVQPFIDKSYDELARYVNAYGQKMQMKREALADKGIWTAKKRYILNVHNNEGIAYAKPKIKVMGLEMIKSSTPSACRVKLKEAINVMFDGNNDNMIAFIDKFRDDFRKLPPIEIAFPRGVNGLNQYAGKSKHVLFEKGTPIHVRGSLIFNNLLKTHKLEKQYATIKEGEKIKFLYLKEPNTIQSNIISFSENLPKEFDIHKFIDYDTQFNKSFLEPLKIILTCLNWKTEHVSSLEDFFS
jgi:DNA polymerase elongation subunit (family B)